MKNGGHCNKTYCKARTQWRSGNFGHKKYPLPPNQVCQHLATHKMKVYLTVTVFAFLQSLPSVHSSRLSKSSKDQEDKEDRRVPAVIQVADLTKCSDTFWEHPAPEGDAQVLPLKIDVDRVFDVQWNPPGHPQLCASWLQTPFGDDWGDYDTTYAREEPADLPGHYTFIKYHQNGKLGLVREKEDGTICSVFREVRFISVSDDVLIRKRGWLLGYNNSRREWTNW